MQQGPSRSRETLHQRDRRAFVPVENLVGHGKDRQREKGDDDAVALSNGYKDREGRVDVGRYPVKAKSL